MRGHVHGNALALMAVALLLGCRTDPRSHARSEQIASLAGEQTLAAVSANLLRGMEGVGGHLTISNKRLIFRPHALNVQRRQVVIPLEDVNGVGRCSVLGAFPTGLYVKTRDGLVYRFVVYRRDELIGMIRERIQRGRGGETSPQTSS